MEKKMVLVAVEHNEQEFLPELDQVPKDSILAEFCPSGFSHCYWLLGEAHSLKLPTLARHHSNHLHELF